MRSKRDNWRKSYQQKGRVLVKKKKVLIKKIQNNIRYLFCYIMSLFFRDRYLFIKAWVEVENGVCSHRNWGDELNVNLIQYLTPKKAVFLPFCRLERLIPIQSYLLVGSVLTVYNLDHMVIWGSGIINHNDIDKIHGTPDRICAVRGPRTRRELEKRGIRCPEVYGDPALLLPRFYQPSVQKRYSMGIIPHYIDQNKDDVARLCRDPGIKLIRVKGYDKWTDFIDEICSCEFVVSSSLHGLITAEAYGIPAVWVEFGDYVDGWEFKFHDFYESIGKEKESPLHINETTGYETLLSKKTDWKRGHINLDKLMAACPIR